MEILPSHRLISINLSKIPRLRKYRNPQVKRWNIDFSQIKTTLSPVNSGNLRIRYSNPSLYPDIQWRRGITTLYQDRVWVHSASLRESKLKKLCKTNSRIPPHQSSTYLCWLIQMEIESTVLVSNSQNLPMNPWPRQWVGIIFIIFQIIRSRNA